MNEPRDPISEWEEAIKRKILEIIIFVVILAMFSCFVAPAFLPLIKKYKRRKYVMYRNFEELSEREMKPYRILFWSIAIVAWTVFVWCNFYYHY